MTHPVFAVAFAVAVLTCAVARAGDTAATQADDAAGCTVDVKRAPGEVRGAIERRLAREARCRPLTVRVIADEGRLFVLAHDEDGRIFESELVDAAAVATVVARWATLPDGEPRCAVEVRRAPDEVRVAIEEWRVGEQRCGLPLIVRVIADEGRLFVLAHDERGRIFERAVPDVASVAALVASWAAQ